MANLCTVCLPRKLKDIGEGMVHFIVATHSSNIMEYDYDGI